MDYYASIGMKIKELREKRNMTHSQLAEGICSDSYISRIERGTRCPNSLILRQFSQKLGISGDYLLRTMESKISLDIYNLINRARTNLECNQFEAVKVLLSNVDITKVDSLYDKQIIMALNYIAENAISKNRIYSLKKIDEILNITYIEGSPPTNVEFGLLLEKARNCVLMSDFSEAKEILNFLEQESLNIVFYVTMKPLIDLFITQSILAYHEARYQEAENFLTTAILEAKTNCLHGVLIECYYLRARIFDSQGKHTKATYWHEHSQLLIDLLINKSNTPYCLDIKRYIDIDDVK